MNQRVGGERERQEEGKKDGKGRKKEREGE